MSCRPGLLRALLPSGAGAFLVFLVPSLSAGAFLVFLLGVKSYILLAHLLLQIVVLLGEAFYGRGDSLNLPL